MTDAPDRIKAYINTRSKHPKLDQDEIHALDAGTDREAFLRLSDVKAILDLHDAQAARIAELEAALREIVTALDYEPEYHDQGMGCGLEDRNITDRYDAMHFGWESAADRYSTEVAAFASDMAATALKGTINDT